MIPGIYRLKQDVENPNGDRRCTQTFWRRPVWKAGTRFVVRQYVEGIYNDKPPMVLEPMSGYDGLRVFGGRTHQSDIDQVLPYLEREEDSLESILRVQSETGEGILRRLLKDGKLTLDDLRHDPV